MPASKHGELEGPKKSPYSLEYYDSQWELDHMQSLEEDTNITKWTKNHGIRIPYHDTDGKFRTYTPDFLVENNNGTVELHEIKGAHLLRLPDTKKKIEAARDWCKKRKIELKVISKY